MEKSIFKRKMEGWDIKTKFLVALQYMLELNLVVERYWQFKVPGSTNQHSTPTSAM